MFKFNKGIFISGTLVLLLIECLYKHMKISAGKMTSVSVIIY